MSPKNTIRLTHHMAGILVILSEGSLPGKTARDLIPSALLSLSLDGLVNIREGKVFLSSAGVLRLPEAKEQVARELAEQCEPLTVAAE